MARPRLSRLVDDLGLTEGYVLRKKAGGGWDGVSAGGSAAWGAITGTLSTQTDLQGVLDAKETAGAVATHEAASDPHPGYLTVAEGNAAYDAINAATNAVASHEGLSDPHPTYLRQIEADALYDSAGAASAAITAHEGAADPHPGYLTVSEGNAAYASISHGHVIGDTTGLQTALDGKSATTHNHDGVYATSGHSHSGLVPSGGTTNQVLKKNSNTNYDYSWQADSTGAGGEAFPVGSVFLSVVSTNPGTLLGYGTWSQIAGGRVLIGQTSGDTDFDTAEETGGSKTSNAVVNHTHTVNVNDPGHSHTQQVMSAATGGLSGVVRDTSSNTVVNDARNTATNTTGITATTDNPAGGGTSFSLMNPYFVVYIWKRTS